MRTLPPLPIVAALPDLATALAQGRQVVLEAPPGAGKSTVVPLALLDADWRGDSRILMLEPRRLAARAVAQRMAAWLGESAGERVGFRTRLESRAGPATRIEVVTEGILTRMLQRDPALEGVACVVFDEFHERNLQGDLGLALALECQRHLRPELRLLVMSATLDGDALARLLDDARFVRAPGRAYAVQTIYAPVPTAASPQSLPQLVTNRILQALSAHPGDLLAFLPGAGEIRRIVTALAAALPADQYDVLPLYGDLATSAQDAALRPDPQRRRKVIVATNIAETSLTIEGVRIVVDAGLERRLRFDPATGMSRLETLRISRASAEQRCGRAGRTADGVCYRLWSESAHAALLPQAPAEILEADLAPLALELACWGAADAAELRWIDPPPAATLAQARDLLTRLEAIDADGRVTALGRAMAALGVHPRLAHMLLRARTLGLARLACELAGLLSERDPLRQAGGAPDPDVRTRIDALRGHALPPGVTVDQPGLRRVERVVQQLERQLERQRGGREPAPAAVAESDAPGLLLAFAYPDRIGRARAGDAGRYLLSGGRGAALPGPAALARAEYIAVAALDAGAREARIQLAAPVDLQLLLEHFAHLVEHAESVEWDARTETVVARRIRSVGGLVIEEAPLRDIGSRAAAAMLAGVRSLGLGCLPWTRELQQWRARVAFARASDSRSDAAWPDVSDDALLGSLEQWLAPWLGGITRRDQLGRVDLAGALHALLDWQAQRQLDAYAPTHCTVPSGSRVAIDYASGVPTLSVRLQEVFGLKASPRIADGRVPVTMALLSPARRPVQVTRDLESFWARGYHEVRKELKGRYPKHYWPDDPREAVATQRVRPRGT
jgi:ATP-dependent helicase HrpB